MGDMIEIMASDGHKLSAYKAAPSGPAKGGLVIVQEVFGLNDNLRRVADRYAGHGFLSVVPAMFDRLEPNLLIPYSEIPRAIETMAKLDNEQVLLDVEAARQEVMSAGKTAIVGYCWGGMVSFMSSCKLDFACALSYYGGGINNLVSIMTPKIPVMYHFGEKDAHIPMSAVEEVKQGHPDGIYHIYDADHGFVCDDRDSYDAACTKLSEERNLAFLVQHM